MDEWGRGPWFDPNVPELSDPGETQAIPPRSTGGPRPSDAPTPGGRTPGASVPLSQRLGPDEWGDLDELATAQGADPAVSSGGPADGSGMRPRPTLSRPLYPPEPWNAYVGPTSGRYGPVSRPAWDELQPPGQGAAGGAGGPGNMGGPNQHGRGRGRRRGRSVLALLLLLLMLVLLVGSIGFVLINSPFKTPIAASATATPTMMGTPTDTPSPTPIPPPTAAKVALSPTTQQFSSAGGMTSCPSGCDITGNSYSHSENASNSFAATQQPQSELDGTIHVVNNSSIDVTATNFVFTGGGYACDPRTFTVLKNKSLDVSCHIGLTSPSSIAANTIHGNVNGNAQVPYTQPAVIQGNGYYFTDCTSANATLEAPYDQAWANGYMAGQSVPSGWKLALSQPKLSYTNLSCTYQQQSGPFNFTASVTANVNDAAYNPGAAQSVAGSRRANLLPSGYLWASRTGCAPNVTGVDGSNKVSLNCSASGTAYYNWTSDAKANLAAAVAGLSKTAALDICNKHTNGVAANSCSISITGGDGTLLPASASVVTIQVNGP